MVIVGGIMVTAIRYAVVVILALLIILVFFSD